MNKKRLLKKQERRETAKLLKHTGLSLPIRYRLAKFYVNGHASGHTFLPDLLKHLSLNIIDFYKGCECCGDDVVIYSDGKKGRLMIRWGNLYSEIEEGYRKKRK